MAILKRPDGVALHYEVHGQGPAILLTHGYSASAAMWSGQIDALSSDHTLILWDMRGHARTSAPEDLSLYSEAATVADMAALLDQVGAAQAIVGGLSLGGYMSLAFHYAHPQRVKALLIIDTGPGFKNDQAREGWNETARKTATRFETEGLGGLRGPEAKVSPHRSADGLARAARTMLTQKDARIINSLPDIRVPALVVVGSEDKPFLAAADYMAAKIPGAEKVVIDGAGHAANMDKPTAFNAALRSFFARHKL